LLSEDDEELLELDDEFEVPDYELFEPLESLSKSIAFSSFYNNFVLDLTSKL
jgi:hypothetical protein